MTLKINKEPNTKLPINDANNDEIPKLNWMNLNGDKVENILVDINNQIDKWSKIYDKSKFEFIVSCDSQRHGNKIIYVTTIVFLRIGSGGSAYYLKEYETIPYSTDKPDKNSAKQRDKVQALIKRRLWNECVKAVKCALWLDTILMPLNLKVIEIHEDINSNKKYKSNDMLKAIVGYIEAVGYKPIIKPNAWVASTIANSKTK